ncbi:MAG: LytTR family DNA-binding domain-containing protein [Oscillospiraceae bacterium]|nr:LytTR family DNA-binding domain-containing protein [Oscillospiraceae bacterium]
MERLNIAVCEDDDADSRYLCGLIAASGASASVSVFKSGEDFLAAGRPDQFDLIFMDIYLDNLSGVDVVRRIRELDEAVPVAFTTNSPDFTRESYRLDVARYIDKPVSQKEVDKMLALARSGKAERNRNVIVWGRRDPIEIPVPRLRYVEQREHSLVFNLAGGGVWKRKGRLDDLEPRLAEYSFFRCHKSYLVNLAFVQGIDRERMVFQMREGGSAYIRRELFYKARSTWENWLFSAARKKGEENG